MFSRIFKTGLALALSISAVVSIAPVSSAENAPTIVNNPFQEEQGKEAAASELQEQVSDLVDLGVVKSTQATDLLATPELPEVTKNYSGNEILNEAMKIVAIDKSTNKVYEDIDQLIEEKQEAKQNSLGTTESLISTDNVQAASLAIFAVSFFDFIGNPDTANADYVTTGTVTGCVGLCIDIDYLIQLSVEASNSRIIGYSGVAWESEEVDTLEDVVLTYPINTTKYLRFNNTAIANERGTLKIAGSKIGNEVLVNTYGKTYPLDYYDPQSNIWLWEPPANLSRNVQTRSSDYRTKFMEYYKKNWGAPTEFTWSQVEIHHMRPLEYGGSNAVSNLIPLMNYANSHSVIPKHSSLDGGHTIFNL